VGGGGKGNASTNIKKKMTAFQKKGRITSGGGGEFLSQRGEKKETVLLKWAGGVDEDLGGNKA